MVDRDEDLEEWRVNISVPTKPIYHHSTDYLLRDHENKLYLAMCMPHTDH